MSLSCPDPNSRIATTRAHPQIYTIPKNRARARLTRKSKVLLASPITSPILAAGTTVILYYRDLRNVTQSISLRRVDYKTELIRIHAQHRRQRANRHGRQLGEEIALHDKRGAWLAVVPRCCNDHELTTPHYGAGHS